MIADEPIARALPCRRIHPACDVIERTERLWQDDKQIAGDRARLIVQRLIETGWLQGSTWVGLPLAAEHQEPTRGRGPYWVDPEPMTAGNHRHG